jgi:iron complex outermembrane recepter protein
VYNLWRNLALDRIPGSILWGDYSMKLKQFGLLCAATMLSTPSVLFAQVAPVNKAADAASSNEVVLEDIVITANRTESFASKTPVTVTAITGKQLAAAGITSTIGIADQVPNLQLNRSNGGLQITIRGVSSPDTTEKGDPSTAFLLDGVYIARPQAQEAGLFDISRIEVLRGPQGTLYGRNTTAGVINVISNKPTDETHAALNATIGNFGTKQVDAMVNVPLAQTLFVRLAAQYNNRDSYFIEKPGALFKLPDYKKDISFRASVLGTPTDSFNFLVRFEYADLKGSAFDTLDQDSFYSSTAQRNPINLKPKSDVARSVGFNLAQPYVTANKSLGLSGEFNFDLGPVTATYLGSFREFKQNEKNSRDFGPFSAPLNVISKAEQSSHELRFATNGDGPFKAQVGAYYFRENNDLDIRLQVPGALLGPLPTIFPGLTAQQATLSKPVKTTSYAFFGQGTYALMPNLRFTAGVRYSDDKKSRVGTAGIIPSLPLPPFPGSPFGIDVNDASASSNKVTWRAGLDYDLNDTSLLYAVVSTGYKAGGFNDGCGAVTVGCTKPRPASDLYYKPETLRAYEVGVKTGLLDNHVRLNASAFYYDYANLQLFTKDPAGQGLAFFFNVPKAKVTGAEVEAMAMFGSHGFDMSATYLDAHYGDYSPVPGISFKGLKLDRSPKLTLSAGYRFTQPVGDGNIVASVRTRYSGAYYLADFFNAFQFKQPGYTKTDASLTYNAPDDRFYVSAFVRNIEDKVEVTAVSPSPPGPGGVISKGNVSGGAPRTFGVRFGVKY